MVKRRAINAKNPLVMKSDESISGRDSAVTEQTEKCSNRKDAKRRMRGYAAFGKRDQGKGVGVDGKGLQGIPPMPPVAKATSNWDDNFPGKAKARTENDSRASNKIEIRGIHKLKAESVPTNQEATMLKKRVSSGQSCSAFFLGDGSTASGLSGKKSVGTISPPREVKGLTGKSKVTCTPKESAPKGDDSAAIGTENKKPLLESKNDLSGTDAEEPKSTSSLTELKSQLLALSKHKPTESKSSQGSEGGDVKPADDAVIHDEPNKSIETDGVDLKDEGKFMNDGNEEGKQAENAAVDDTEEESDKSEQANAKEVRATDDAGTDNDKEDDDEPKTDNNADSNAGSKVARSIELKSTASGTKKRQMTMTSFLGKQSKVINEEAEFVDEDEKDNADRYAGILEQASDEVMDIHLQATLSDCEYSSVQSSVTTDKLFEAQPSLIKRTGSLIRNPLLRRNRSKKKDDDEVIQCMKNGKLAAKADNNRVEDFDERPNHKQHKRGQRSRQRSRSMDRIRSKRSGVSDFDEITPSTSSEKPNSEDVEEMYDFNSSPRHLSDKKTHKDSVDDSSCGQDLLTKGTFDDSLMKRGGGLPNVDTSAKVDVKSPSFRLSAVSGAGTGLHSPLAQQMMINALNERAQPNSAIQNNMQGAINYVPSAAHGAQTSTESQAGIRSSFGTFGDVVETVGLFSARLCLGTGAAIVSCSRACNDNPKGDLRHVSLDANSFVEPDIGVFSSPRNVAVTSPRVASPRNDIFRDGPRSPASASNGYTQALADAISKMPEQEQLDLVRQLSSRSHTLSPRSADMTSMASSVDGMFYQHGSRMKRVPHNIAAKSKPNIMTAEEQLFQQQKMNHKPEAKPAKTTMGRFKKGIKRLAKTRLTVMYQV